MHTIQTILHPTDFSESAGHAFRLACSLARDHEADVVVVHVVDTTVPYAGETPILTDLSFEEEQGITQQLETMRHEHPNIPISCRLSKAPVVEGILAAANDANAGLIVMGTHGRRGLQRLLMGSVAEKVMRQSRCPVLTVKSPPAPAAKRPAEEESSFTDRPMMATPY